MFSQVNNGLGNGYLNRNGRRLPRGQGSGYFVFWFSVWMSTRAVGRTRLGSDR
jgi:hypothetical protein